MPELKPCPCCGEEYIESLEQQLQAKDNALGQVDKGHLMDWLINSVDNSTPIWTEEHIDELLKDFDVCFKDDKNKEFKDLLAYQCSELNTMNDKLLDENSELRLQLQAKDKVLDKAIKSRELVDDCPPERNCCLLDDKNYNSEEYACNVCWKEWCENGVD